MVSRIGRGSSATKLISKPRRCRRQSPVKGPPSPSSLVSFIRRRLARIFSRLTRLSTPESARIRCEGFELQKKLHAEPDASPTVHMSLFRDHCRLPPSHMRTVFVDLDETLVHSQSDPPPERFDFVVRPVINGRRMTFYVLKRPGLDEFLEAVSKRYEVVVFTAGMKEYASLVLDEIDRNSAISHRLYRNDCREMDGKLVKDLSCTGRNLRDAVIVDDNPNAYALQPENAVPIGPFTDNLEDEELQRLVEFFEGCGEAEDMRDAVKQFLGETYNTLVL
ncbi:hypothetical protein MLD38_027590 [Melastoma candidum]|uniref:Uncharacterized protein n=1 Tax=Melastoma candidum TaxID=119954 RepID=A0ACB9P3A2_9MYRT|nr:hypothetical protein MLD38_027590 [Melastoma candidum]